MNAVGLHKAKSAQKPLVLILSFFPFNVKISFLC